jgi:hypothetical protein
MKKYLAILIVYILTIGINPLNSFNKTNCNTRIVIDGGVGHELLINFSKDKLNILTPKRINTNNGFIINGCKYYINWNIIDKNYSQYNIENKLNILSEKLFFENQIIKFPPKVKIRDVWQAVQWSNWVLILGRTSKSDEIANLKPSFLATEFFFFNISNRKVEYIKFIDSYTPSGNRIWILDPQ